MEEAQRTEEMQKTTPPALSDAIEKIMANPELISMVASVLGKESPSRNEPKSETVSEPTAPAAKELPELVGTLAPLLSGFKKDGGATGGGAKSNSACLLRALKPYLSQGRRDAVDYMIRISEFSEILKRLQ